MWQSVGTWNDKSGHIEGVTDVFPSLCSIWVPQKGLGGGGGGEGSAPVERSQNHYTL